MLIELNSVASIINDQTLIIYPMYIDGNVDFNSPTHLYHCSNDWMESLSKSDKEIVNHLLDIKKYVK
jgi:hypothetical protein